jgi:hypothetical protein
MKHIALIAVMLCAALPAAAKTKLPPKAPLPTQILQAKTIFLVNGGVRDLIYDAAYQDFKDWGKFQLVGSPDQADLVVELDDSESSQGSSTYYNAYTNTASTVDRTVDTFTLVVADPKSKAVLWTTSQSIGRVPVWGIKKACLKMAESLVDEMKSRCQ